MALSNVEITKVLKKYSPNLFYRVDAYDQFDPKHCPFFPVAIVCNTRPIAETTGGHWVVLYIDSERKGIFFDSGSLEPWGKFRHFFNLHASRTEYNLNVLQLNNFSCGYHAVYFVTQIKKKKSFKKILHSYSLHFDHDKMVIRYYKKLNNAAA